MSWFDDLEVWFANLTGRSADIAGFLLGFALAFFLMLIVLLVFKRIGQDAPFLPFLAVGVALSVLVGWWPPWTVIFIVIILAWMFIKPFGSSTGGGV